MANQQQQLTDICIRLDRLEQAAKIAPVQDRSLRNGLLIGIVVAAAGGLGTWAWFITSNVIALKQGFADGGNKAIVAQLSNPESPEQLQANLSTVIAQVQTNQVEKKKPNETKVANLSAAVSDVIQKNPLLPDAWKAAGELITFRAGQVDTESQNCVPEAPHNGSILATQDVRYFVGLKYKDCTLNLNDINALEIAAMEKASEATSHHNFGTILRDKTQVWIKLDLTNVHVIYDGGDLRLITQIVFRDCTFQWHLQEPPPVEGASITKRLLVSTDMANVQVDLPKENHEKS